MSSNEESDDEQLKYAIALSLQDHTNGKDETASGVLQVTPSSFLLSSLDRKKMEEERLARIAKKRPRAVIEEEAIMAAPDPKRMMLMGTDHTSTNATVPFPNGVVRRTWARGYNRSSDDIKIEEVLQKDELLLAFFSSFQWDEPWLLSKIDITRTKVLLAAFASDESQVCLRAACLLCNIWTASLTIDQKQAMRSNAPKNIKFCFPPMHGPGAMHSKLQILKYPRYLRIVIPSGNLVPYDWGETGHMENVCAPLNIWRIVLFSHVLIPKQMLFMIDLPLKDANNQAPAVTNFSDHLQHYVGAMGVENGMVESLSKYDFTRTENLAFVYSM
jgi:hypothetical protein